MQQKRISQSRKFPNKLLLLLVLLLLSIMLIKETLTRAHLATAGPEAAVSFQLVPEHKRTAKKVLITIPSQSPNDEFSKLAQETYGELLVNFPSYTKFEVVVSDKNLDLARKLFANNSLQDRVTFHVTEDQETEIEAWAQDYFEPALSWKDGSNIFLLPKLKLDEHSQKPQQDHERRSQQRNILVSQISEKNEIKELPFFFEGGNVLIAENQKGEPLVLIDYDNVSKSFPENHNLSKVAETLSAGFGGSNVVIIGNTKRKKNFIHLDQSILFLPDNIVFVNKIKGFPRSSASRQHETYTKQLDQLGFKTITINTSENDVENFRSSLNAISFWDKEKHRTKTIFPVFENELKEEVSEVIAKEDLKGKALQMYKELEKLDIQPIPLLDKNLFKNKAGYHCIVNILE